MCQKSKKQGKKDNSSMIEQLRNKAKNYRFYNPKSRRCLCVILLFAISISIILLFSVGLEWFGKWGFGMPKDDNGSTSNVYPDFLGGFIGVIGGFLIDLSIIQKIRNHYKRERIINALKEEFYDIIYTLWKCYYDETTEDEIKKISEENDEIVKFFKEDGRSIKFHLDFNKKEWRDFFDRCFSVNVLYSWIVYNKLNSLSIHPTDNLKINCSRDDKKSIVIKAKLVEETVISTENVSLLYSERCKEVYNSIYRINKYISEINDNKNDVSIALIKEFMFFFLLTDREIKKKINHAQKKQIQKE